MASEFSPRAQLALAVVLAALVVLPRGILITDAHNESLDAPAYIHHGLAFFEGTFNRIEWVRSVPLGPALGALPLWLAGVRPHGLDLVLYDQPLSPEAALRRVAIWKSLLFLPLVALSFQWCRSLYGDRAGWLAAAALTLEPSFAAHIPLPTSDVLGVEGIALASWLGWRYAARPTRPRLIAMSMGVGVALMLKTTAVILPGVVMLTALLFWRAPPPRIVGAPSPPPELGRAWVAEQLVLGVATMLLSVWALTGFDLAPLLNQAGEARPIPGWFAPIASWRVPGRMFLAAIWDAIGHSRDGWPAFLLGAHSHTGWWYYFPVVSAYKMPLGILALFALGVLSLRRRPLRLDELSLLVPLAAWSALLLTSRINIGFRHFLPAYFFMILLSSRAVAGAPRGATIAAWLAVAFGGAHAAAFHPDYLSYVNFPREKVARDIGDSNLDWGQAMKQIARWIDARPRDGRPIWLVYHSQLRDALGRHVGTRATSLDLAEQRPTSGILIISPLLETGLPRLRPLVPDAVIGHAALVYDLDRQAGRKPFDWADSK